MMISTKGRYALRVMIDLAEHQGEGYIPLKEIAQRQEISEKYLESILKVLVREHFLIGVRGKGGGYRLSRTPKQYTIGSIIRLTENSLSPVACLDPHALTCPRAAQCRTLPIWKKLDQVVNDFFDSYTLADLAEHSESGGDFVI
ncbi:RrF2 family transcriptional regulator [Anaerotruncus colihominis]|uniref:Rrf2 family transcriptional regulator n=1 Tax=Anaerotruncus colihominis TaxID=169435 RepID=A0A845SXT2_9FIRM|nr:Rrf2 family transcriptional regulator [Anaerotruncus colihominis]MCR2024116.1 Rrf2 family transcriptional regulator [Anaerotruncus colihominis]NDO39333.1 Rrf2 family transcriptional regulator [Anaerotruncus colihominis]